MSPGINYFDTFYLDTLNSINNSDYMEICDSINNHAHYTHPFDKLNKLSNENKKLKKLILKYKFLLNKGKNLE